MPQNALQQEPPACARTLARFPTSPFALPVARNLYNGTDPYSLPLYSQREAAHIVGVAPSTVRGWVVPVARGANVSEPVIHLPDVDDGRLSFYNVIEAFVLRLVRTHGVTMADVRKAVAHAERQMNVDRLLIRKELRWESGGHLFWDELSSLTNLSKSGQLAMRQLVRAYLHHVEWNEATGLPQRFFPTLPTGADARAVVVDPRVSFGQPTVAGTGVGTAVVARRINAGEDPEAVAADYGVDVERLTEALVYEETR